MTIVINTNLIFKYTCVWQIIMRYGAGKSDSGIHNEPYFGCDLLCQVKGNQVRNIPFISLVVAVGNKRHYMSKVTFEINTMILEKQIYLHTQYA